MYRVSKTEIHTLNPCNVYQTKPENKEDKSEEAAEKQEAEEPLDTTVLDEFTYNIFPGI